MKLDEAIAEFKEKLERRGYSARTVDGYGQDLTALFRYAQERNGSAAPMVGELTAEMVEGFLGRANGDQLPASTYRNRRLSVIRMFFLFLAESGNPVVTENPTERLRFARVRRHEPSFLSYEEYERILRAIGKRADSVQRVRDYAIVVVLYNTGLRLAELVGLNAGQFDRRGAWLIGLRRKGGVVRDLPVNANAVHAITGWLARRGAWAANGESALFVSQRGTRLSGRQVQHLAARYARIADVRKPVTPHTFRHSHCTEIQRRGADVETARRLLDHRDLKTTARYSHTTDEAMRLALDSLNDPETWLERQ